MTRPRPQIIVYPDRVKLLLYACLFLGAMGGTTLLGYWCVRGAFPGSGNPLGSWLPDLLLSLGIVGQIAGGLVALVLTLALAALLVCTAYRIVAKKPSVIVNSDGLTDQCSLIAGGVGMIHWDEIAALSVEVRKRSDIYQVSTVRRSYLVVILRDERPIVARLNPLVRKLLPGYSRNLRAGVDLPQWLFSVPANELVVEIERRFGQTIRAHDVSVLGLSRHALER